MIISKTPFRMSFFGGGTDYPAWFNDHGGSVLATTIDKYCYISCRHLPPFFEHKYRVVYSKIENVQDISEIQHPAVRAALQYVGIAEGLEIHHDGDLPARTGLGSSSSFTVGMLHALHAHKGNMPTKRTLAMEAIHVEQDMLEENVGCQDQILASHGGFSRVDFAREGDYRVTPITASTERLQALHKHLLLYFTGISRFASDIAKTQIENVEKKKQELAEMQKMVDQAIAILADGADIKDFGRLLHESWMLKRSLTRKISTPEIDDLYNAARDAGAIGGKLLGAGGGGFVLLFADPDSHAVIERRLEGRLRVPFQFERQGTQIAVYEPDMTPKYH